MGIKRHRPEEIVTKLRQVAPRRIGSDLGQAHSDGSRTGKLLSPSRRRACIDHVRNEMRVSERRVCRVLGQHRSTQRRLPVGRSDEDRLVADMIELTRQFGQCEQVDGKVRANGH